MKMRRKHSEIHRRVVLICLSVSALLALPMLSIAEPRLIQIEECALNGFSLGGTIEEMRSALGEPDSITLEINTGDDNPHLESHYEGLDIVFSVHGRKALNYRVTSKEYRLPSGVGVGSTRSEIERALGRTSYYRSGDTVFMVYRLADPHGRPLPVQLDITLDGEIAARLSLISR